jgi:hypothetical protein
MPASTSTTTTAVDPTIQPYLSSGLAEAQRLYTAGGPSYYTGQTYVSPSQQTLTGLQALEQRATQGNPLLGQAQGAVSGAIQGQQSPAAQMYANIYGQAGASPTSQFYSGLMGGTVNPAMAGTQATASGQFLGGNPFFQGAFAPAAQAATQQFQTAIGDIGSAASKAGRYGSGAMGTLQERASGQLAKSLSDTAGQLAYQNYAAERGMQESAQGRLAGLSQQDIANRMAAAGGLGQNYQQALATQLAATGGVGSTYASDEARQLTAAGMAPGLAQADYQDIQNLLTAGQAREGYTGQQTAADIARFNFGQNAPQQNLATFLSSVYGNPLGTTRNTSQTGTTSGPSGFQNLLGGAATLGGLYRNIGGTAGLSSIGNWLSSFGGGGGGGGGFVADPYAYQFGTQYWE